jgi:hypothetical protein
MQDVHLQRRERSLQQEKTQFEQATADQLRYVSPANPRGTPPPPRPRRPHSDDLIQQVELMLDQASRLGVSIRAGDLPIYGSDGNRSAFEAMVEAGQQIQQMGLHVLNTGLMIGSFIPGPIGILSNGISMMMALANGDEAWSKPEDAAAGCRLADGRSRAALVPTRWNGLAFPAPAAPSPC